LVNLIANCQSIRTHRITAILLQYRSSEAVKHISSNSIGCMTRGSKLWEWAS